MCLSNSFLWFSSAFVLKNSFYLNKYFFNVQISFFFFFVFSPNVRLYISCLLHARVALVDERKFFWMLLSWFFNKISFYKKILFNQQSSHEWIFKNEFNGWTRIIILITNSLYIYFMYYHNCRRSHKDVNPKIFFKLNYYKRKKINFFHEWHFIHERNRLTINIWSFTPRALSPRGEKKSSHNWSYYASSSIKCKEAKRKKKRTFANIKTSRYWFFMCSSNFSFPPTVVYTMRWGKIFLQALFPIFPHRISSSYGRRRRCREWEEKKFLLNMRLDFRQHERHIFQYVKWPDHFEEFSDHFTFFMLYIIALWRYSLQIFLSHTATYQFRWQVFFNF